MGFYVVSHYNHNCDMHKACDSVWLMVRSPPSKGLSSFLARVQPATVQNLTNHTSGDEGRQHKLGGLWLSDLHSYYSYLSASLKHFTRTLWVKNDQMLIFCKTKYFSISPLALFPGHSIHFCCTSTVNAKI